MPNYIGARPRQGGRSSKDAAIPLVSVITPAFDSADTIARCIASVRAQGFSDWEHLIADDLSKDGTLDRAFEAASGDPRIRPFRLDAKAGAAGARNAALRAAGGRFVAFLDADDRWLPDKLSTQLAAMMPCGDPLTYGNYLVQDEGDREPTRRFEPPARLGYRDLLKGCPIGCSTVMLDRDRLGAVEMPPIARGQDWALWLRLARTGCTMSAFPGTHTVYARRKGSLSSKKLRKLANVWEIYRHHEELGPAASAYFSLRHSFYVAAGKRRYSRMASEAEPSA